MTSIRRLLSGISSPAISWARYEITAPIRQKPTAPIEPVRRGFSDHSDFQSSEDVEGSLLDAHAPNLAGRPRKTPDPLSAYTGRSDFQARLPRYQHLLGTHVPPPPSRYWEGSRTRAQAAPAQQAPQALDTREGPGLTASTDLEQSFELAGDEDSILLYSGEGQEGGRSVVQHADGSVTDPADPENRLADLRTWESSHPELSRSVSLSRNDLELVLAMPEGEARDEVLSELASANGSEASGVGGASGDDFMPSLDDLPVDSEPEPELSASDGFMPSLEDLPGSEELGAQALSDSEAAVPLSSEELQAEGRGPLELAELVARRGTPEQQAQVANTLYEQSQSPEQAEASTLAQGSALAASGSPQATYALLQRVGEAHLADFVRAVMQA